MAALAVGMVALLMMLFAISAAMNGQVSLITFTAHSQESHAEQMPAIEQCFDGGGSIRWFQQADGNYAKHCNDGFKSFWRIATCRAGELIVITQFKQKLSGFGNYVRNKGMVEVTKPPCS